MLSSTFMVAQVYTLADWETTTTSLDFASFANGVEDADYDHYVVNPNMSGINQSDSVLLWKKNENAASWGGGFGFLEEPVINFEGDKAIMTIKVMADHLCTFKMKLEGSTTGQDVSLDADYTTVNEWQVLTYDFSMEDADGDIGLGHSYPKIVFFPEFGLAPAAETSYWMDDLTVDETFAPVMINDFETEDLMDIFFYGNGHFADSSFAIVPNPNSSGINTSSNVRHWCKADNANTWGGFGFAVDTLDFTGSKAVVCMQVMASHAATFRMKLFESPTGQDLRQEADYTTPGEWQMLCFDFATPGVNGNVGLGHQYFKVALYPDYPNIPAADDCYHFDNFSKVTNGNGSLLFIKDVISQDAELSTFKDYVDQADFWSVVNKAGAYVFAPTNASFDALSTDDRAALDNNTDFALFNMILHHVTFDSIPEVVDGASYVMRNGQDGMVSGTAVNGANVASSVEAINGYVHVVESVLTYPADPTAYWYATYETEELSPTWSQFGTNANLVNGFKVANPFPGGVNTTDNVLLYKKYPNSEVWQGAFIDLDRPFNFMNDMTDVCFDFYSDIDGAALRMKLEHNVTTPGAEPQRYEKTVSANTWTTLCMDMNSSSLVDPYAPGAPDVFERLTLFIDYKNPDVPTDTTVYYIDNIRVKSNLVGVNNISQLENFEMSPNPTADYLDINSDTPIKTATIFDVTGRVLFTSVDPINNNLDVRHLDAGMYFIKFVGFNGETQGAIRFVKQ